MSLSMSNTGKSPDRAECEGDPAEELDDFVRAFEDAYCRYGVADPAAYLPPADHPLHAAVLRELIRVDMEYRWEQGLPKPLEDYQGAFPGLSDDRDALKEIAFEEFRLRYQAGHNPSPKEYLDRFGLELDLRAGRFQSVRNQAENLRNHAEKGNGSARSEVWGRENWLNTHRFGHDGAVSNRLPEAGTEFLGFRLISELGRGSFGRVFLARQGEMADRHVVLKVTDDNQDEAQTLAQLQHRNIVPIYSRHREGTLHAVCMPYLGAVTLRDVFEDMKARGTLPDSGRGLLTSLSKSSVLKGVENLADDSWTATVRDPGASEPSTGHAVDNGDQSGPRPDISLPPYAPGPEPAAVVPESGNDPDARRLLGRYSYVDAILWMGARLADGLSHAHGRGIFHRDIKPANVLVTEDGRPMLLDFNLAEDIKIHSEESSQRASLGGTLPYMAPEHLDAFRDGLRPVDARSDVYSLGVILFELLTGRPPFPVREGSRRETLAIMIADRQGPPPRLRPWNPAVSPAVESIVGHCLEPEPDNRYDSARSLLEDLERHLAHQPLKHAPDPSRRERASKWVKRHPWLISFLVLGTLGLGGGGGIASKLTAQRERIGRYEAHMTVAKFDLAAKDTFTKLNSPRSNRNITEAGLKEAAKQLAVLGLRADAPQTKWWDRPPVSLLPTTERDRTRDEVGQMLMSVAWAETRLAKNETDSSASDRRYRAALITCERAEIAYGSGRIPKALWELRVDLLTRLGEKEAARQSAARAKSTPLVTSQDHYLLGIGLLYRQEPEKARPFLEQAARLDPRNFQAVFNAGYCSLKLGKSPSAESYFKACISLSPDDPITWLYHALVNEEQGNLTIAAADLETALRLRPNDPHILYEHGVVALKLGNHKQAIESFSGALSAGEDPARTLLARGQVRSRLGDIEGGSRDIEQSLKLPVFDEMGWLNRGFYLLKQGENIKALEHFDQTLRINPRSSAALINKAHILSERLGRNQEAVASLDQVLRDMPESAEVWANRAVLKARLDQDDGARVDAEVALSWRPTFDTVYRVANTYALTSRHQPDDRHEALRYLRFALSHGYGLDRVDDDPDFASLRDDPDFLRIVERAKTAKAAAIPARTLSITSKPTAKPTIPKP